MNTLSLPPTDYLNNILRYNPTTEVLLWKISPSANVKVGDEAGCASDGGRLLVSVGDKLYKVHRLVWMCGMPRHR